MNLHTLDLAQAPTGAQPQAPTQTPTEATLALPSQAVDPSQAPAQMPAQMPTQMPAADPAALLEMLRDIHLPAAVAWWPPAPGWWVLLAVALLVLLGWRFRWHEKWRRFRHPPHEPAVESRAVALREIERARSAFIASGDFHALAAALSVLLRRVSLQFAPRDEVAALTGESWLAWLDAQAQGEGFSSGPGRALADAPYRAGAAAVDGEALLGLCEKWVQAMFRRSET